MGIRGETVTDVSQRLLAHHGGLRGLFRLDVAELARVRGIGDAVPCEDEPDFGTQPLVSCDALTDDPDAQQALQGLYDHTRDEGDPYGLDQGGDPAIACDGEGDGADEPDPLDGAPRERRGNDEEALDGPPPDRSRRDREARDASPPMTSSGPTVVVSAAPLGDFASLEARLDARIAALEAEFAAFEERAENGFGRFEESADDASTEGQRPTVAVSTSRQPAGMMPLVGPTTSGTEAMRTQSARSEGKLLHAFQFGRPHRQPVGHGLPPALQRRRPP